MPIGHSRNAWDDPGRLDIAARQIYVDREARLGIEPIEPKWDKTRCHRTQRLKNQSLCPFPLCNYEGNGNMAWYENLNHLNQADTSLKHWKTLYGPGSTVPVSGIYRCRGCTKEITSNKDDDFPPQNKHQHADDDGDIQWELIVRTNTKGEKK